MSFLSSGVPISYWKKLGKILKEEVKPLYDLDSSIVSPIILNQRQFFYASMILNNSKMIPKDNEMELPTANQQRKYSHLFEQKWTAGHPSIMIGSPDIRTCGNHRSESLLNSCDFIAFFIPDHWIATDGIFYGVDQELNEFFNALALFQKFRGVNSLDIFDYCIQGKFINVSRRYVATIDEYIDYYQRSFQFQTILKNSRRKNCFWCYQSLIGLTVQGLTKGILYNNVEHIPKAMPEIIQNYQFIDVPLAAVTSVIAKTLFQCNPKTILQKYNALIEELSKEEFFELALHRKDQEMIKLARAEFVLNETISPIILFGSNGPTEKTNITLQNSVFNRQSRKKKNVIEKYQRK